MTLQFNLQDSFLAAVKKEDQTVVIYLAKGVQLKGQIRGYDSFTVFLEDGEGRVHMIYKHAITTVTPTRPLATPFIGEALSPPRPAGPAGSAPPAP